MLAVQLRELVGGAPEAVDEALDLVAGFDGSLTGGLGRMGDRQAAALSAFAGALAGSPLGGPVGEAAEKVVAGSIGDDRLAALAGGRAALLGAVHDALLERLDGALGRSRSPWEERAGKPSAGTAPENLLAGARSWLYELAIAGWRGVDHDLVSAAGQTIEGLWGEPSLRRLAVLLDGLASELRASCPVATMERVPERRWADLWTRAVLLARAGSWTGGGAEPVSGRLLVLGVDVHEHGTAVQVQVHGVLEPADGGEARLVRTGVAAAKVDTIVGPAVWRLLYAYPVLLAALAERRVLDVVDMPLTVGGDLLWREDAAQAGEAADPFTTARVQLGEATAPSVPPLDRHPVRIAEPVLLEGYRYDDGAVSLDGTTLEIDSGRLPACGPITPSLVKASTACIGLVRWDGRRWLLQPLALQATIKKKPVEAHTGDWALGPTDPKVVKAEARAGDAVAVLRERAGRLLRK
ncbi:hypothetical protein ACH35V_34620 [Actinomadura sp. 1N219]|uniref:hypothetical protein n=1 Tax=Actinomadura sp. 1N219 TaxID=3375152 RepID=UPI00379C3A22